MGRCGQKTERYEQNGNISSHKTSGDHDGRYYTEAEVNALLKSKVDYRSTNSLIITKDFTPDENAYLNAPVIIKAASDNHYAGIALHNPYREAAVLYLKDGCLILIKNTGERYKIQMESLGKSEV